jgi:hypothetical protein
VIRSSCLLLLSLLLPAVAFGLGYDHEQGNLPLRESWPPGLYDVVNTPRRVSGYWINGSDTLYFAGDGTRLNRMINAISRIEELKTEIVLHPGPGTAKTAYLIKDIGPADWAVTISNPFATGTGEHRVRFDIWVGGAISLDSLAIPKGVPLRSSGEIEDFVLQHNSEAKE